MENLIKQMSKAKSPRVREENNEETEGIRNRKIPIQKTQSFKGAAKKGGQNWFRRQFSQDLSRDYDSMDNGDYPTAVAAAAFAITSLDKPRTSPPVRTREEPTTSFTKSKSKAEDGTTPATEPKSITKKNSDGKPGVPDKRVSFHYDIEDKMLDKAIPPAASIKRTTSSADKQSELEYEANRKTVDSLPSIKKTDAYSDKHLDRTSSRKSEFTVPKPERLPTIQPTEITRQSSTKPVTGGSKADAWQRSEMTKIKDRYEKMIAKILHWETKKKTKAHNKMVMIEGELEKRRARAQENYRSKVKTIEQVAGGARAQAEENRRNEEFKAKEKANKIRSTGKLPATCFCF